ASEPSFAGLIRLSETAGDRTSAGGAGGVVTDCGEIAVSVATTFVTAVFPRSCIPHHAPAENNAATATRPITTLNPGRELPGREMRRRNGKARGSSISVVGSSIANSSSTTSGSGNSATGSGNSTRAAGMTTGWTSATRPGTTSGNGGAAFETCRVAGTGDGESPVS